MTADLWEDQEDDTPLVAQLRKQIKALTKEKTEALDGKAAAEGKLTEYTLKSTLADKVSNPDRAAKFLAKDGVDTSDEAAVSAWLEENSDLFPAKQTAEANPAEAEQQDGPDEETVRGYEAFTHLNHINRPADSSALDAALRSLPDNATPEQVAAVMRKAGV